MSFSRSQEYPYQYKTISAANASAGGFGPTLTLNFPDNILALRTLYMHFIVQFNASVISANQQISNIIFNIAQTEVAGTSTPTSGGYLVPVNLTADGSRVIDSRIDLQSQIPNLTIYPGNGSTQPYGYISLRFPTFLGVPSTYTANVVLWKVDFTYTITGIR